MPQQFDVGAARQAGASDDQILSYLAQRAPGFDVQAALKQASKQEVIGYLSTHSSPPGVGRPDFALSPPGVQRPSNPIQTQELQNPRSPNYDAPLPGFTEGTPLRESLADWTEQGPGGVLVTGPREIVRGNYAKGAHKMLAGAGTTMLPTLPIVGAAAPVATAVTLGTGSAGQYAGKKTALALGATEDQSDVVGDVTGFAAGYGGAKLPRLASRLRAPLGDTATTPRGTIPPEQHSPAELKAYADKYGIPLNAAQATEHNLPRNLQSAGERASIGGSAVRQQIKASQAGVAEHTEALMDTLSPKTPDVATAGEVIQKNVAKALESEQVASRQEYATIDQRSGGVQVDLKPVKKTAQRVLDDSKFVRKVGALDQKRAAKILQDMVDKLPERGSFSQAQQLRSALLDASRSPDLAISNQAQAWIKQLTGTVDAEMMNAARAKPMLESEFREANDHWQRLQEDFNNSRSPLAQILQEPDPSKVPQKLTQRGQTGGSPYNARLLDRYGIDKGPVKRVIVSDMLSKDFRLWNKTLAGYSKEFLQTVFSPEELDHVYKTGAIARSVGMNTNPSGTAGVTGAMEDVQKPVRSLIPKAAAAKATRSPAFNNWMMQAKRPSGRRVPLALLLGATAGARREDQP